jgi:mRNA interferase MazF
MGAFAKGDVVLFPVPYTDLSNRKLRPCLILSEEMRDDLLLCQITSKSQKDKYSVELKKSDNLNGSLNIDSYIRSNMIFTADKSQIHKKFCRIKNEKYEEVIDAILKIIQK